MHNSGDFWIMNSSHDYDSSIKLIEKYKKKLIESTNIESRPEEMLVIDNILFRFWQLGWLNILEKN